MPDAPAATKRVRPKKGEEVEVTIDSLAHGGAGIGRAEAGFVVFVRGVVPGDRIRARIDKAKRSFAEASLTELIEPSPDRRDVEIAHPGAPWQVMPYEMQLAEKQQQVSDALTRLGGFDDPPVEQIIPAVEQWRYRNKVEYSFATNEDGSLTLGFHHPGRWDLIDPVERDILASERVDQVREEVLEWCGAEGLTAYDRGEHTGFLRNLVVREGRRTGQLQIRLVTSKGPFRHDEFAAAVSADSVLWTQAEGVAETTRGGRTKKLKGEAMLAEELQIGNELLRFGISADAFFQTNTEMAERLYAEAVRAADLGGGERVFDLYCGIGTIALALALDCAEVVGVESVERAVADAIANARANGVDNARFYAGDVRTAMRPLLEEEGSADVVVIDPPRAGLSQKVVRRVLEVGAEKIVYVSCNPTTLAPNARQMVDAGYELRCVRPVDMFPQTPHIECVALLSRG
ncbi:MAG: 23S rRNA (uracil(1939)-C(5))-methyltransferase RlmD [Thermoleophilaceae bacterium]